LQCRTTGLRSQEHEGFFNFCGKLLQMRKIGFIDHYIDEWHANNYPTLIRASQYPEQFDVALAWAEIDPPGKLPLSEWCKGHGVRQAESLEQVAAASRSTSTSPSPPRWRRRSGCSTGRRRTTRR
jgi:hypothetical protein